jgi:Tfp pilus assembly protein PilF
MSGRRPHAERSSVVSPPRRGSTASLGSVVLIIAVGLFAYAGSFRGLFVLDEQSAIIDNPNIRSLGTSLSAPAEVGLGGRPVASLSFAINYALAPDASRDYFAPPPPGYPREAWEALYRNLWGYHGTNLAIHLLAALAVFGIVRRTLTGTRMRPLVGGAATILALIVAALWVAHPLNTSAVTYVAQRVESLMGLFYLASFYCAIRAGEPVSASDAPGPALARGRRLWVIASVAACALGVGTKEVIVTLPIVLVLYDLVFLNPQSGRMGDVWRRRWPLYAGLAGTWVLSAVLVASAPRAASVGVGLGWSPWLYLQTQAGVIVHYLRLVFVPWPLVFDYEWPAARTLGEVLPYATPLVVLFGLTVWALVRRHPLGFPGASVFLILAPSSSVLPIVTEIAAEHRMYLPLAAIIGTVVVGSWVGIRRWFRPQAGGRHPPAASGRRSRHEAGWFGVDPLAAAVLTLAVLAIAGCALLTRARNLDYQSEERLWTDTVVKRPSNARALANLAVVLTGQGRTADAEPYLRRALAIRPDYPEALSGLGAVLAMQGRVDDALPLFARATALAPRYADAWNNYAEALATKGRLREALTAYRRVLALTPDHPGALAMAAWILATSLDDTLRDGAAALTFAQRAATLTNRRDVRALDSLAAALAAMGRYREAVEEAGYAAAAARSRGMADLASAIDARRRLYEAGQPYREGPGPR